MRSLPNVIKSNAFIISDSDVKVINSNSLDKFSPFQFRSVTPVEVGHEAESVAPNEITNEEEVYQMNHQMNSSDKLQEMHAYAESILEDAKKQAESIKNEALLQAEMMIEELKTKAIEEGHQEGLARGQSYIDKRMQELEKKEQFLDQQYDQKMVEMQDKVTDLLIALVQKITGVILEERSIITFLVMDAIKSQTACNEFRISVSKKDYQKVYDSLPQLEELVRSTAVITIIENPELSENQCKIETEKNIIDCGIETKIENLTETLKLIR